MIKAALKILCLITVLTAPALRAQTGDAAAMATDEAVRRQALLIKLKQEFADAQSAQARNDLIEAARLYQECFQYAQVVGPPADYLRGDIISGRNTVLLALAHDDQAHHEYDRAEARFKLVLATDPQNEAVIRAEKENKAILEAQAGMQPDGPTLDMRPTLHSNEVQAATFVQDGKFLYEAGKYDEAEVKLKQALALEPNNLPAYQYLRLVTEKRDAGANRQGAIDSARAMLQVDKSWDVSQRTQQLTPRPNSFNRTNLVYTGKGRQTIISKLDRIHVEKVNYPDLTLQVVLNDLAKTSLARDPDGKGINFFFDRTAPPVSFAATSPVGPDGALLTAAPPQQQDQGSFDVSQVHVRLSLNDVRLADVLDAITKSADPEHPIKYSVLDYAVVFSLRGNEPVPLEIRTFHVDPNTFIQGLEGVVGIPFGGNNSGGGSGGIGGSGGSSGGGGGGFGGGGSSGGSSGGIGGSSGGQNGSGNSSGSATVAQVSVTGGGGYAIGSGVTTGGGGGGGIGGGGGGGIGSGGGGGIGGGGGGAGGRGGGGGQNGGGNNGGGIHFLTENDSTAVIASAVRSYFISAGVDLSTNQGKVVIFNDRKGTLTVRATAQDLDLIEAAIQTLNTSPPEINIKAKFVEITQNDSRALGFNWNLGNFRIGANGAVVASGGTQPTLQGANGNTFPGVTNALTGVSTLINNATSDGSITQGLRNTFVGGSSTSTAIPAIATITGILTDPQFRATINALQQRDGTDVLTAPEVTTESGRQAQMQAVDIQQIVTSSGLGFGNSGATTSGSGTVVAGASTPAFSPGTTTLSFGPTLDVIAYVSADEFSVQMTLIPSVTDFIGYDNPGSFVPTASVPSGGTITSVLPLPHFRLRQVVTSVTVWDAQTVVIGGLMSDTIANTKDSVPIIGDLPLVGRLFRSEASQKAKKNLMIFVTPTIINPDGTRYHSDDEMPFAQNGTITQRASNP